MVAKSLNSVNVHLERLNYDSHQKAKENLDRNHRRCNSRAPRHVIRPLLRQIAIALSAVEG
jgi:hypothetical protein